MKLIYNVLLMFTLTLNVAWGGLEGNSNTAYGNGAGNTAGDDDSSIFIGKFAGYYNTSGHSNAFLGASAGFYHTIGFDNIFLGSYAGFYTTTGYFNTFLGSASGSSNTTGNKNTFLGSHAGLANTSGVGNVFVGHSAGGQALDSNRLYIANTNTPTPLIYGEFDNKKVIFYGNVEMIGPESGIFKLTDNKTNNSPKATRLVLMHYTNAQEPVYLMGAASTLSQNFVAFGGGNAIGSAATQLDFFTATNNTTVSGTSRLTINSNGNIGMGVTAPAHPLHMASGAVVTAGGVWTNASSRDYKENIKSLSTKEAALTLASLTPVTYNYKVDKTQAHVGFIAEDVPELVATKDRKGLSPMDIVAVLTKVTQEQQRALQEQQRVNQQQQNMMFDQGEIITRLSTELVEIKRKVKRLEPLPSQLTSKKHLEDKRLQKGAL